MDEKKECISRRDATSKRIAIYFGDGNWIVIRGRYPDHEQTSRGYIVNDIKSPSEVPSNLLLGEFSNGPGK